MKSSYLSCILLWFLFNETKVLAQILPGSPSNFITEWNTQGATSLVMPGYGDPNDYFYYVYWEEVGNPANNGSALAAFQPNFTITGLQPNTAYRVEIHGDFPRFSFDVLPPYNYPGNPNSILWVRQWGSMAFQTLAHAFYNAHSLDVSATDVPNLSQVSDCSGMFYGCFSLKGIGANWNWNTSTVTNMESMFYECGQFNQSIGSWDVSQVTDMYQMFMGATNFNQPLDNWNTSSVVNMGNMFRGAGAFNQPIGSWNTSQVTNMAGMFYQASSFNQPIESWNTGNVVSMKNMFSFAAAFNQPIGNWNTTNVTNMYAMFWNAQSFNQPLENWNTSSVMNIGAMFSMATQFNQPLHSWNVSSVTEMGGMFGFASSFNQPLGSWDVSNVTDMLQMFMGATAFDQNLGSWQLNPNVMMASIFNMAGLSCLNYDSTLTGWANNPMTPTARVLGAVSSYYTAYGAPARSFLINNLGWTISDQGISGIFYVDADGDGYGNPLEPVCGPGGPGFSLDNSDCNDADSTIHFGASETCNGMDDNCNGIADEGLEQTYFLDNDGDGFGWAASFISDCVQPPGYVLNSADCDDNAGAVNPGATEICNFIDDNCNGLSDDDDPAVVGQHHWFQDEDEDGYGDWTSDTLACFQPKGFVNDSTDCDDNDDKIHPGATEECNGVDDNCNGFVDEGCVGISEAENNIMIRVQPTLFRERFGIFFFGESEENVEISILDIHGRLMESLRLNSSPDGSLWLGEKLLPGVHVVIVKGLHIKTHSIRIIKL
jgi:surface protein